MKSPIYWHPKLYALVMKVLYGKSNEERLRYIAKQVGSLDVLDIGCGDCSLAKYLSKKQYSGADINETFVNYAKKRGYNVFKLDVLSEKIPRSSCIVLSGILHQLYPNHEKVLEKALSSSRVKIIVSESYKHIAESKNPLISCIARFLNDPGYGSPRKRLNKNELFSFYKKYGAKSIKIVGREAVAVFEKY